VTKSLRSGIGWTWNIYWSKKDSLWTAVDHFKAKVGILGWVLGDHSAERRSVLYGPSLMQPFLEILLLCHRDGWLRLPSLFHSGRKESQISWGKTYMTRVEGVTEIQEFRHYLARAFTFESWLPFQLNRGSWGIRLNSSYSLTLQILDASLFLLNPIANLQRLISFLLVSCRLKHWCMKPITQASISLRTVRSVTSNTVAIRPAVWRLHYEVTLSISSCSKDDISGKIISSFFHTSNWLRKNIFLTS
jgi:hypothetical protein